MSAEPAFHGFIENTFDALLLFEATRRGDIPKITRRLQEFEKKAMVSSGAIFVFDEEETGIKRWTDGLSWSPSRTLGNFLVYRELDKKSAKSTAAPVDHGHGSMMNHHGGPIYHDDEDDQLRSPHSIPTRKRSLSDASGTVNKSRERALVGSLTSTFRFRPDGLVKKTISLAGLHMVCYYRIEDVTAGHLRSPSSHAELASLQIASCFLSPTLFRVPPLVDLGSDGQLRYKGELDPSASPMLMSRSTSSQGFGTPLMPPVRLQSRTRSNSPPGPVSHREPSQESNKYESHHEPTKYESHHERELAPNSPRRTTSHRNRYEPYAGGRISPPSVAAFPSYPFPIQGQTYSPNQSYPAVLSREEYYSSSTTSSREASGTSGLSPAMAGLSSGTMNPNWGSGPQSTSLSRSGMSEHIYQPRHATPFAPNEGHHSTNSESFAFRAPTRPSPLLSNSPTPSYESFSAPPMQTQYSSSSNSSRYGPPPPSYSQHGRPYGHQSQHSGSSTYSVGSYRDHSHLPPVSPRHSPQEYSTLSQSSYPNSNRSSSSHLNNNHNNNNNNKLPGYPPSPQQPSGMVMGEMEGPELRLGLGLQGIRGKIPFLDSSGRRRRRSDDVGFGDYNEVGEEDGEMRREEKSNHSRLSNGSSKEQYWDSPVEGWQTGKAEYSEKRRSR